MSHKVIIVTGNKVEGLVDNRLVISEQFIGTEAQHQAIHRVQVALQNHQASESQAPIFEKEKCKA